MPSHGFMHLVRYRQSRELLMATPPSLPQDFAPDIGGGAPGHRRGLARSAHLARSGRNDHGVFGLWHRRSRRRRWRETPRKPSRRQSRISPRATPWSLKILSPDIVHKSEVGGVRLNLTSEQAVRQAAAEILAGARSRETASADHRRHGVSHDRAPQGARTDRRRRGRSHLRSRHRVRPRRHRGRGHQRQGAGAAAARPRAGAHA